MCQPGYFGQFCRSPCPPGSFGPECGGFCSPKCSNYKCHHVYGCPEDHETTPQTTISIHPENTFKHVTTSTQKFFATATNAVFTREKFTTKRDIQGVQITPEIFSYNTKKNVVFVNVNPESKNEFQVMLVGVGALISLFLFIIVIQLCKRSKSSIKRNVRRNASNESSLHIETSYQANQRGYNVISEQPKDHSYASFEVQYSEITENVERNIPSTSSQDTYGASGLFDRSSSIIDTDIDTMNDNFVEDTAEELRMSVNSSNYYLKPIYVPPKPRRSEKEQENVYINVKQE